MTYATSSVARQALSIGIAVVVASLETSEPSAHTAINGQHCQSVLHIGQEGVASLCALVSASIQTSDKNTYAQYGQTKQQIQVSNTGIACKVCKYLCRACSINDLGVTQVSGVCGLVQRGDMLQKGGPHAIQLEHVAVLT